MTTNNHQMTSEALKAKGYKEYTGKDMSVFFNRSICIHAGKCVAGNIAVFNPKQRPWIKVDEDRAEHIKAIIDQCPSGALQYEKES